MLFARSMHRIARLASLSLALALSACVTDEPPETGPTCRYNGLPSPPTCAEYPSLCGLRVIADVREPDAAHAVDVVFLPDGFTEGELESFHTLVRGWMTALDADSGSIQGRAPALFNRYLVDLPSPSNAVTNASVLDTPLRGCLLHDELNPASPPGLSAQLALPLLAARSAVASPDVVVVVLNTHEGRMNAPLLIEPLSPTGMVVANLDARPPELDHELGHALVHLGDEYFELFECFTDSLRGAPAIGSPGDWWNELAFMPNVTTEPLAARFRGVWPGSYYSGGSRYAQCVFHPYGDCRMNIAKTSPFCPVCNAAIDRELQRIRDGVDRTPPACGMSVTPPLTDRFELCPRSVARFGAARFTVRGPDGAVLTEGSYEKRSDAEHGGGLIEQPCVQVDARTWADGDARLTIECANTAGVTASNTLTLAIHHAP